MSNKHSFGLETLNYDIFPSPV